MDNKSKLRIRLPKIADADLDKLSSEQLDFIVHPLDQLCFLKACPGSGKTEVVGIKASYETAAWEGNFSGIAVLSFTRNAAKEIGCRIAKYNNVHSVRHPHFVGTIDSWLHNYLLHPYGHLEMKYVPTGSDKSIRLVDSNANYSYLSQYNTNLIKPGGQRAVVWVNDFYLNQKGECESSNDSNAWIDTLPDAEAKKLKANKERFLGHGWATYQDAEYICSKVLSIEHNALFFAKRFPVVIVDECQDLSYSQLAILHRLVTHGGKVHLVGDLNQAIYEFRKVSVDKLEKFVEVNGFAKKALVKNFRSNQQIVDVCQQIAIILEKTTPIAPISGLTAVDSSERCLLWEYTDIGTLPNRFIEYLVTQNEISLEKSAILARSHSVLSAFRPTTTRDLNKAELFAHALTSWKLPDRTTKDMQNALHQVGKCISALAWSGQGKHQSQYCPAGYSEIEWRIFLFNLLTRASHALHPFAKKTWKDWINNDLKTFLKAEWKALPLRPRDWDLAKKGLKSKDGTGDKEIESQLKSVCSHRSDEIRITTIHDVKGETLDAAMLVSSSDKRGGTTGRYFTDWIGETGNMEFVRFAFVASSRPKHLLIWAIPLQKDRSQTAKLTKMGFKL